MLLLPSNLLVLHFWIQPTVDQNIKEKKKFQKLPQNKNLNLLCTSNYLGFPGGASVKNLPANANAEDIRGLGSIPGWERLPGEGNGSSLQYSCLENPMDRGAWQAIVHGITKSWTQLKRLSTQLLFCSIYFVFTTVSLILAIISNLEMTESI